MRLCREYWAENSSVYLQVCHRRCHDCFTQMPFSVAYDSSVHFLTGVGESGPPSLLSTGVPRNLWSLENQAFPDTLQQDFARYLYHVIQRICWGEKWYGESASWWQVRGEGGAWDPQTAPLAGWQQLNCLVWFLCRYVYGTLTHITFPLNVILLTVCRLGAQVQENERAVSSQDIKIAIWNKFW